MKNAMVQSTGAMNTPHIFYLKYEYIARILFFIRPWEINL